MPCHGGLLLLPLVSYALFQTTSPTVLFHANDVMKLSIISILMHPNRIIWNFRFGSLGRQKKMPPPLVKSASEPAPIQSSLPAPHLEVGKWLSRLDLSQYGHLFESYKGVEELLNFSEAQIRDLGVKNSAHRASIVSSLVALRNKYDRAGCDRRSTTRIEPDPIGGMVGWWDGGMEGPLAGGIEYFGHYTLMHLHVSSPFQTPLPSSMTRVRWRARGGPLHIESGLIATALGKLSSSQVIAEDNGSRRKCVIAIFLFLQLHRQSDSDAVKNNVASLLLVSA
ncbi:unnamed protein product [Nezara viridula]|uniref:SAM domain-containing protein n=1 Tax=Nezara viridula TaxID=85310 RepID=A0A9P0E7K3_NEZVI|nr:unnamed protein product [Nezara viridula]